MRRVERNLWCKAHTPPWRWLMIAAVCAALCLALGAVASRVAAQEDEAAAPDPLADRQGVEARLDELRRQLNEVESVAAEDGELPAEQELRDEIELLERLQALYLDQQQAEGRAAQLAEDRRATAGSVSLPDHPPPYSVAELDRLLDHLEIARTSRASFAAALEAGREGREQAERRQDELATQLDQQKDAVLSSPIDHQLQPRSHLELQKRIARQEVELLDQQLANDRLALETQTEQEEKLRALVAQVRTELQVSEEDLREARLRFAAEEEELARREKRLRREIENLQSEVARVEATAAAAPDGGDAQARLGDARARLAIAQQSAALVAERSEQLDLLRSTWELRLAFLRGELTDRDQLRGAERRLSEAVSELDLDRRRRRSQLVQLRAQQLELAGGSGERRARLEDLAEQHLEDLERLNEMSAQIERPLTAIRDRLHEVGWGERLWDGVRGVLAVGEIELLKVQDHSITIGAILGAILLVSVGSWMARRASAIIARRLLVRLRLDVGAVATFQALIFYFLLIVLLVWALKLVNIPLTVFTFLGGALAIGVGFGSQNIVNNFMSGLILMAERPIKVGDLVEVQGTSGHVEHIGPRSTRVRAGNNTHIIVPNSAFLEGNVLNWTLSDNIIRTYVDVGVAYGSDLEEVRRQLERALVNSDNVLDHPSPELLFMDFGDNALHFRVLFWTQVRQSLDQVRAQSQMRFKIDVFFRQSDITIAFPQRDVHLDGLGPVEVHLRRDSAPAKDEPDK